MSTTQDREAAGLLVYKPRRPSQQAKSSHNTGKQPSRNIRAKDDFFVNSLILSGIPTVELDNAFFPVTSRFRLVNLLARYKEMPLVASKLSLITKGSRISNRRFTRIKPIYLSARGFEASSSSTAMLPL